MPTAEPHDVEEIMFLLMNELDDEIDKRMTETGKESYQILADDPFFAGQIKMFNRIADNLITGRTELTEIRVSITI